MSDDECMHDHDDEEWQYVEPVAPSYAMKVADLVGIGLRGAALVAGAAQAALQAWAVECFAAANHAREEDEKIQAATEIRMETLDLIQRIEKGATP